MLLLNHEPPRGLDKHSDGTFNRPTTRPNRLPSAQLVSVAPRLSMPQMAVSRRASRHRVTRPAPCSVYRFGLSRWSDRNQRLGDNVHPEKTPDRESKPVGLIVRNRHRLIHRVSENPRNPRQTPRHPPPNLLLLLFRRQRYF